MSSMESGNPLVCKPCILLSLISSQYPPSFKMSSFFVSGKYKKLVEKLKGPALIEYGKNLPYSPRLFISSIILVLSSSKDSLEYCLFKIQYFFFLIPTQPKQYSHSRHISKYSEYRDDDHAQYFSA